MGLDLSLAEAAQEAHSAGPLMVHAVSTGGLQNWPHWESVPATVTPSHAPDLDGRMETIISENPGHRPLPPSHPSSDSS